MNPCEHMDGLDVDLANAATEIETLRARVKELEPFKSAYLEQVELHNKTLDELAACEKERDEWMHEFKAEYKRGAEQPNTYQQLNKILMEERKHIRYLLTLAYGKLYAYKINLRDPALTSQIEKYLQTTSD